MKLNDWLTLGAIVMGPTVAVVITLAIEAARRKRERRFQIIRMLLSTRHIVADPQYSAAINLIPAEFHAHEDIMEAWRAYHVVVRERPAEEYKPDHQRRTNAAQSTLIFRIVRSVGLNISEADIQTQAYISQGMADREKIYLDSLLAMPKIADSLKKQGELTEIIVNNIPGRHQ